MSLCLSCGGGTASSYACNCDSAEVRIVETTVLETRVATLEARVRELEALLPKTTPEDTRAKTAHWQVYKDRRSSEGF